MFRSRDWRGLNAGILTANLTARNAPDGSPPVLVEVLRDRGGLVASDKEAQQVLLKLIGNGRLVLLVNAIDQTLTEENVARKLDQLQSFLANELHNCPAVISGRPYAIRRPSPCRCVRQSQQKR